MRKFEINLCALDLGGGWKLALYEDEVEVSGGVFPAGVDGYCNALDQGENWLSAAGATVIKGTGTPG
jgi:hypothetical protein